MNSVFQPKKQSLTNFGMIVGATPQRRFSIQNGDLRPETNPLNFRTPNIFGATPQGRIRFLWEPTTGRGPSSAEMGTSRQLFGWKICRESVPNVIDDTKIKKRTNRSRNPCGLTQVCNFFRQRLAFGSMFCFRSSSILRRSSSARCFLDK